MTQQNNEQGFLMRSLKTFSFNKQANTHSAFGNYFIVEKNNQVVLQIALRHPSDCLPALNDLINLFKMRGICVDQDAFPVIVNEDTLVGHYSDKKSTANTASANTAIVAGVVSIHPTHVSIELAPNSTTAQIERLTKLLEEEIGIQKRQQGFPQSYQSVDSAVTNTSSITIKK